MASRRREDPARGIPPASPWWLILSRTLLLNHDAVPCVSGVRQIRVPAVIHPQAARDGHHARLLFTA